MDENITELHQLIMRFKHDTLKEVFIFDYYDNKKADLIKIGYRFIFQSNEKTLTDHDVNEIISSLINKSLTISVLKFLVFKYDVNKKNNFSKYKILSKYPSKRGRSFFDKFLNIIKKESATKYIKISKFGSFFYKYT